MFNGEIGATWENGVLRPESGLGLPEHTKLVLTIRRVEVSSESRAEGRRLFHEFRDKKLVRANGRKMTRDDMHERG